MKKLPDISRYFLIFVLPLAVACLLHYGTSSLKAAAHEQSAEWISLAMSPDREINSAAFKSVLDRDHLDLSKRLNLLGAASILLVGALGGLLVPVGHSNVMKLRLLEFMTYGLFAANVVFGFGYMSWPMFAVWVAGAIVVAGLVILLRQIFEPPNRSE